MSNRHIELPSATAAVLSTGVVMAKRGEFEDGEGVRRRIYAFCTAVDSSVLNGNERHCEICMDIEDRI